MYIKNGKSVREPKMVDAKHYRVGKEVLPFTGPIKRTHEDMVNLAIDTYFTILRLIDDYSYVEKAFASKYPCDHLLLAAPQSIEADKVVLPPPDEEAQPIFSPTVMTTVKPDKPRMSIPMTYRQKRYLYVLTRQNFACSDLTIEEASAYIADVLNNHKRAA